MHACAPRSTIRFQAGGLTFADLGNDTLVEFGESCSDGAIECIIEAIRRRGYVVNWVARREIEIKGKATN